MLGWALIINNLGRRRYPMYWWAPGQTLVSATKAERRKRQMNELRNIEAGLRITEGDAFAGNSSGQDDSGNTIEPKPQAEKSATNGHRGP